jgi:uncharacterized membrane protein (DUF485 family)
MQQELAERILELPRFKELVARRNRLAWSLAIIVLVVYYTYILVIAFDPAVFGTPISGKSVITIGIPIGAGIILMCWLMTGLYVNRANKVYDELTEEVVREVTGT